MKRKLKNKNYYEQCNRNRKITVADYFYKGCIYTYEVTENVTYQLGKNKIKGSEREIEVEYDECKTVPI